MGKNLMWRGIQTFASRSYTCGHCGNPLASEKGFTAFWEGTPSSVHVAFIMICHHCCRPTFFDINNAQTPGVAFGNTVSDITDESIATLYDEARRATGANCPTLAVLACRKLLMHIAVAKGAKAGESFATYVEYLSDNNFVPPDAKGWVDHIRKLGNIANHEIAIMKPENAEELLSFMEMLLKVIFEFPGQVRRKYPEKDESNQRMKADQ